MPPYLSERKPIAIPPFLFPDQNLPHDILGLHDNVVQALIISFIVGEWIGMISHQSEQSRQIATISMLTMLATAAVISYAVQDPVYSAISLGYGAGFVTYGLAQALARRLFRSHRQ